MLGVTVHTTISALRRHGVDVDRPQLGAAPSAVGAEPSPRLVAISQGMAAMTAAEVDACAADVVRLHPLLRALAPLAATPPAWIDLVCRAWRAMTPALRWSFSFSGATVRLSFLGCEPSLEGFAALTRGVIRHAPTLTGELPLHAAAQTKTTTTFLVAAQSSSSALRASLATDIPIDAVLAVFPALLSPAASGMPAGTDDARHRAGPAIVSGCRADRFSAVVQRHGLTPAEARVLRALQHGARPAGVAVELGVSVATVRVHLKRIYAKTGAHTQRRLLALLDDVTSMHNAGATACKRSA